ncbi:NlpC/P60 family protein [Pseudochrobactrum saccharolyticum]|uniref:NlpC/P60 family putative phage cell wall peptidase n=1 Tax=Pseudochrobactrum saccharolyticum TaxID=354352 RepID=A0A7W8EMT8_9HYPH|nr:NlpC/P60 family protein [Pseudochrobactrum saccharolyticum]KAB0540042.1 peptidase P60 [Pseudochrobactrum saccharolyticum]MBB5089519.1 NlpC/P60 family putative phage cell wall peptidase [Pseudochrobactrum saccharolyticum]MDP8251407.1 C40 family peptidase [Pseudochrobactrum saccharolyticum]
MTAAPLNDKVLAIAEKWLGTPYRHGASRLQVGCDCLGLIRGIWRELYGTEPEDAGTYSRDWAELAQDEPLIDAARRHMHLKPQSEIQAGDILIFRWRDGVAAKHLGIMAENNRFIHAYEGHSVTLSALVPQWRQRIAAVFSFPNPSV